LSFAVFTSAREQVEVSATNEFPYPVPAGAHRMSEISKAIQYCKECQV
jgi:hypothetical protein